MRRIGTLPNEDQARRFCDYLLTLSIDARVDADGEGETTIWNLWIRDEHAIHQARDELTKFVHEPDHERYQVKQQVEEIRSQRAADQQRRLQYQRKVVHRSAPGGSRRMGFPQNISVRQQKIPVTVTLIGLAVVISFMTNFGRPKPVDQGLSLQQKLFFALPVVDLREYIVTGDQYQALKRGELWRIVTPMFMHGDMMHLVFNMLWIYVFGSLLERLHGSFFFFVLVIATHSMGICVELATTGVEFLPEFFQGSPMAIGASGGVSGLFGYLWIRPMVDKSYPIYMAPINVVLILGWILVCMTPLVQGVANGAHVGGLIAGIVIALSFRKK